jgi:hypothetical protein
MSKLIRRYNAHPSTPDRRDFMATIVSPARLAAIPDVIDMRTIPGRMPPVVDQGDEGSCTGNGWAGAFDIQLAAQGLPWLSPSRQFIYRAERVIEGDVTQDGGAQVRTGAKVLSIAGAPPESMWPYLPANFSKLPPTNVFAVARRHRITRYERVAATPEAIFAELAGGAAVVLGFTVFESFESDAVAQTGVLHMPVKGERVLGGHCTVFVGGHITSRTPTALVDGALLVRNSWGPGWGQGGYFTMPFGYLHKRLVSDCWAIREITVTP